MKYSIEELYLIFKDHAKSYDEHNEYLIRQFKEDYPDERLPEHFKHPFNLSWALLSICTAILNLQDHER